MIHTCLGTIHHPSCESYYIIVSNQYLVKFGLATNGREDAQNWAPMFSDNSPAAD